MEKIVLTGGTHTGKTSILKNISEKGFFTVDEVAQKNMQLLSQILGYQNYRSWRKENFFKFQEMNIFSNLILNFIKNISYNSIA